MKFAASARLVGIFVGLVGFGLSAASAQTDPRIGTWKLNMVKSSAPGPAPQSDTRTYEATPDGTQVMVVVVDANGTSHRVTYTAKLDGKDYPTSGIANYDTVALTLRNENTVEMTLKKAGQVVETGTTVVSKDGRTMTVRSARGPEMLVFDRQP